jgi:putative membrane protein
MKRTTWPNWFPIGYAAAECPMSRLDPFLVPALLSAIHVLTLALGLGAVFLRGRALAEVLDDAGWKRLLAADTAWGVAAFLWIASGVGRVFFGGKAPDFYWRNGFFWVKLTLFAAVFALEVVPMTTFLRVRASRSHGTPMPRFSVPLLRRLNTAEFVLVIAIVVMATLMARGAWLF